MNADLALIIRCCAPREPDTGPHAINALASQISDWDRLEQLAARCRATAALCNGLQHAGVTQIPGPLRTRLASARRAAAVRYTQALHQLCTIQETLSNRGIPMLAFKGPVLASICYAHPSSRIFDDVDILVHPQQLADAYIALREAGYSDPLPTQGQIASPRPTSFLLRPTTAGLDVDLSSKATHDYFSLQISNTDLWHNARNVALEEGHLQTLDHPVSLVMLCAHGTKHLWRRPAWIADVAGMARLPDMNWERVQDVARKAGAHRMLELGLQLADHYFPQARPDRHRTTTSRSTQLSRLVDDTQADLTDSAGIEPEDTLRRMRYHLRARERSIDKIRYLLIRAFRPSANDLAARLFPPRLSFLYYVTRPIRLVLREIRKGDSSAKH